MDRKVSIIDSINAFGLTVYVVVIGSAGYLTAKGIKKLLDILAETLLQRYVGSIRKEVKIYMVPMQSRLNTMELEMGSIKRHDDNNAKMQVALLNEVLSKINLTKPKKGD